MKSLYLFLVCSLLFSVNPTKVEAKAGTEGYEVFFFKGLEYFDSENYSNAAKYFNQSLIASRNSFYPALLYIAESYLKEGMYNQAGSFYWKFIRRAMENKSEDEKSEYLLRYYLRVIDGLSDCYKLNYDIAERITKNMKAHSISCRDLYLDILYSSLYKAFLRRNFTGSFNAARVFVNEIEKTTFDPRLIDVELIMFCIFVESKKMRNAANFVENFGGRYTRKAVENANVPYTIIQHTKKYSGKFVDYHRQSYKNASNLNQRLKQSSHREYKRSILTKRTLLLFF